MDTDNLFKAGQAECRSVAFTDMDVAKDGKSFRGYAAVYGQEADLGSFIEVMVPPALHADVVQRSGNIPMLWDHNVGLPPLATTGGGTLRVSSDKRGLMVEADVDERHMLGPTLMSMLERGDVKGMSFGFVVDRKGGQKIQQRSARVIRTITGISKLLDVSPTWNPAYEGTSAELRSLRQMSALMEDPEQVTQADGLEQGDGPELPTAEAEIEPDTSEVDVPESDQKDEQRSGVEPTDVEVEAAARSRRLQMMGLSLPRGL